MRWEGPCYLTYGQVWDLWIVCACYSQVIIVSAEEECCGSLERPRPLFIHGVPTGMRRMAVLRAPGGLMNSYSRTYIFLPRHCVP